jgi:cytochrome oxidase assembly protein ShyY1
VRFLLSRRWVLFALAVVILAYACVLLGRWQFHRLHDREQRNEWARVNLASAPASVHDVMSVGIPLPEQREWTRVRAVGQYDEAATVTVRYQTRDGESGVDVVTPLVTSDGTGVLVDRGWVPTGNTGAAPEHLPTPPPGQVEVVGWARADATGDSTQVDDDSTRAIASTAIGRSLDYPVYAGFVDARTETPAPTDKVVRAEEPDLGNGPHLFYGIQWWFFGALALFGFAYLAWDEWRKRGADESPPTPDVIPSAPPGDQSV